MSEAGKQEKDKSGGEKLKPIMSPFSPFPYGSPVQQGTIQSPFSGSPAQKYLLNSFARGNNSRDSFSQANNFSRGNSLAAEPPTCSDNVATPRLRGQDLYGGPVMFGGGSSALRRGRMLSATPYSAALRNREREREKARPQAPPTPATPTPTTDAMSSTARVILDTLDKMSTPIQDARKIPVPRAEKRKMIEDELNCSLNSLSRRRPRLGSGVQTMLNGPPLRKNYSPVPVRGSSSGSRLGAPSTSSIGLNYEKEGGASSGKVRAKVSEKGRAKAMQELTESETALPSFLTTSVPTLDIKFDKLPEIDLKSSVQTQAKAEGVKASQKAEGSPKPKTGGFNFESGAGGFSLKPKVGESNLQSKSGGFNFESKSVGFNFEPKTNPSVSLSANAVTPSANKQSVPTTNAVKPTSYIQDQPLNSLQPKQKTSLSHPDSKADNSPKTVSPSLPSSPPVVLPVNNLPPANKKRSFSSSTSVNENDRDEKRPRFSFAVPAFVSNDATKPVSTKFSFSAPEQSGTVAVNGKDNAQCKNSESGYSSLNSSSSSLTKVPTIKNHVTSLSPRRKESSLRQESSLPDVANSVMMFGQGGKQGVDVLRDSPSVASNRLPDVTTSTGFGGISASPSSGFRGLSAKPSAGFGGFSAPPSSAGFGAAKELKTGSVMDILGKK